MDKYSKIKNIGEGAFGKALLVRDKKSSHQYVVKEIPIHKMKPREREDARKEVSVLAQMHHPYIVTYRESFEEKGFLHIVMDFCEKGDLYHKISSQRGILLPEDQVMDWFVQIALAIKYVHDRKILHRDIKTQNIFLTANGTVQLGDFGIAKVLGSTVELSRTCIGTPYYLSPEMCENRPYNNKSDIWSLGCVLYELTTLKHAFEAGNMKNLVLKIIRGSYPPISPKYSYDLRGLIAKLFKRTPRDRPSVNSILKMPFVQRKVPKFLTDEQIADEFSHTIMHGQKLGHPRKPPSPSPVNRTPAPGVRPPSGAARRPLPPKPTPAAAPKKYNPANIYGAPVARKSNEKSQDKKRPGSNSGSRPQSAQDLQRKKQEFIEKERKRREGAQKAAIEKKHKDLMEKQKMNRINKAREDGWKNMVGSLGSDDSGKNSDNNKGNQGQIKWPAPKPSEPQQQPNYKDRGDYQDYHAYLDKLDRDRQDRQNAPGGAAYMAAPRQAAVPRAGVAPRVPAATPMQHPQAEEFRQKGNDASERARIVNEFIQRKKEAEANRRRGHNEMFGGAAPWEPPRNIASPSPRQDNSRPSSARDDGRPSSADARRKDEEEYLERLKKIRQANYMDRKNDKYSEAEVRRKKIEALRQQADDKAKNLREQLERQRRELINKEDKMRGNQAQRYAQGRDRPGSAPSARPMPKPVPAVGLTGVLHAIGSEPPQPEPLKTPPGIGMTGALQAIGAKEESPDDRPKSALQMKKEEILKGVNQRGPPRGGWGAPPEKLNIEIKEEEQPESSRSQWGEKLDDRLKNLPLQETASAMEVTSARDKVIVNPRDVAADAASRGQWGRPGSTFMNALKDVPIMEGGGTMSSDKSDDSVPSSVVSTESEPKSAVGSTITISATESKPGIGSTITLPKPSVQTGTITIASTEKKENITRPEIELPKAADSESLENSASQSKSESSVTSERQTSQSDDNKEPVKSSSEGQLTKPPVSTKPVFNKPPLPSKPAPAEKPLVLPKPTLLAKPESPMDFGKDQVPKAVNVKGEGSLFSKVELDPDESGDSAQEKEKVKVDEIKNDKLKVEEVKGDIPKDKNNKPLSGVAVALTTGHFDMKNTGLLRTCSEPDLSKLNNEGVIKEERRSLDLQRDKEDESDDDEETENDSKENGDGEKSADDKDEDENEDDDDEDYDDLMSVRETMASLLLRECSTDDENKNTGKFRLSAASNSKEDDIEEENDEKTNDAGDENGEDDDDENKDDDENGDDNENVVNNYAEALEEDEEEEYKDDSALFQSDESDADTQFGDDEDNYDLFSRLEESREELENQLGCDKFLKVYKAVQALQEDEDESIEDGARLAMNMLGKDQEHLYPKIFQLVMADAAFTEDNS